MMPREIQARFGWIHGKYHFINETKFSSNIKIYFI